MRFLIIILIIILSTVFMVNCGPPPTGETNYKEIKESIQRGEDQPKQAPDESERGETQQVEEPGLS